MVLSSHQYHAGGRLAHAAKTRSRICATMPTAIRHTRTMTSQLYPGWTTFEIAHLLSSMVFKFGRPIEKLVGLYNQGNRPKEWLQRVKRWDLNALGIQSHIIRIFFTAFRYHDIFELDSLKTPSVSPKNSQSLSEQVRQLPHSREPYEESGM